MSGNIGGVDANIPLQAGRGVQQPNPLQQIGQFAQIQNALNTAKLNPLIQQQLQLGNQRAQLGLQSDQSALIQQQRQLGAGALAPLLAKKTPLSIDDVTSALAGAEKSGVVTQPMLDDFMNVKMTGDPALDDAAIRAHIAGNLQAPANAAAAVSPGAGPILSNGQNLITTTQTPAGLPGSGQITPTGTQVPVYPSRSELNGRTIIGYDPQTKAPIYGPAAAVTPPALGGPAATESAFPNGGRIPAALRNPANAPPPTTGVVSGAPGPGQTAALATGADMSTHAFQDIADRGVQALGQNAILGTMLGDTSQFTTGENAWNNYKTTLTRNAPAIAAAFGIKPESVAANESFDKFANQIADAQGAGSDARLAVTQAANPSSHLSQGGADLIIRQLQGNADYIQARAKLAADFPDQTNRPGFEKQIGTQLDPRAFQFARLTPQQKVDYVKSIKSPQDKARLQSSYNYAVNQGLIGGANAGQ